MGGQSWLPVALWWLGCCCGLVAPHLTRLRGLRSPARSIRARRAPPGGARRAARLFVPADADSQGGGASAELPRRARRQFAQHGHRRSRQSGAQRLRATAAQWTERQAAHGALAALRRPPLQLRVLVGSDSVDRGSEVRRHCDAIESGARSRARRTRRPAARLFRFRVPTQDAEQVTQNNAREALIQVNDRVEKVLYYEGEPRVELKFVRRAVAEDKNLQLVTLDRTAENKYLRQGVSNSEELIAGFPKTREELFAYRALVLGSVEAASFTPEQLRMIADFV